MKAVKTVHIVAQESQRTSATDTNASRPPRYSRTSTEWPCIFGLDFTREQIDPRIKTEWEAQRSDKPKWGDLRNTFRREHCRAINPWGSETCPFAPEDCAISFLKGVQQSLKARNPHGYFIKVALSSGSYRADEGVERRARIRTDVSESPSMGAVVPAGLRAGSPSGLEGSGLADHVDPMATSSGTRVRGKVSRPERLGTLLGSIDLRARPEARRDGGAEGE